MASQYSGNWTWVMRQESKSESAQKAQIRQKTSVDVPVEVPVGGWNTRDAADNVPQQDAVLMDNWVPGLGEVALRGGRSVHAYSGTLGRPPGQVQTLAVFDSGAINKLLAFDGGKAFDVSSQGPSTEITNDGQTITENVFDFANFRGSGDNGQLILCNGTQNPFAYNGISNLDNISPALSGMSNPPAGCHSFKNRMYYWEGGDQSVWYTELYAPGGTVVEFPLGSVGQFGGYLLGMYTWTHDGGSGPDDHAVFVMSSGDVLVYQGEYPGSISDWAIVGTYNIGTPLHTRGVVKFGGDLIIMTDLDFVFLSNAILGEEANTNLTKISGAIQDAAANAGQFGWDAIVYPLRKYLIFNVPAGDEYVQFLMNTVTGAWCRLRDLEANCWAVFNGDLYFGSSDGVVYRAFINDLDELKEYVHSVETFEYNYVTSGSAEDLPLGRFIDKTGSNGTIEVMAHDRNGNRVIEPGDISDGDEIRVEKDASNYKVFTLTNNPLWNILSLDYFIVTATITDSLGSIGENDEVDITFVDLINTYIDSAQPIQGEIQTAYLNFGTIENKTFDALKMFFRCATEVLYESDFAVDFESFRPIPFTPSDETSQTPWGSPWGSPWTSSGSVSSRWEKIAGYGRVVSMRMKVSMKTALSWELSIWHIEKGDAM